VLALALAGLAYWQRGVAVEQQQLAEQQRKRADDTLSAATKTANDLIFDLAQRFENQIGIPAALVKDILYRTLALQERLTQAGGITPDLKRSGAEAFLAVTDALLTIGDSKGALAAAEQARQVMGVTAADPRVVMHVEDRIAQA
jgi:hypothetical protein